MTKIRGFELVSTYNNQDLLPKRETAHAAGYDLKVAENTMTVSYTHLRAHET